MFDPHMVVQSAASSFNNAAIVAPSFFWLAFLMLPLFALVYKYGNEFIAGIKWLDFTSAKKRILNFALGVELSIFAWLIFLHGNYEVLRDSTTALPFALAVIVFFLTASIINRLQVINPPIPQLIRDMKRNRLVLSVFFVFMVALVGLSGMPTFWGFLLQSAALVCGLLVGLSWKKVRAPIPFLSIIVFALSILILMQPEFFRFGQLGNLTYIHMLFILMISLLVPAIFVLRNIKPRGQMRQSVFVKIKLLARLFSITAFLLFIFTESIPVFLGFAGIMMLSFALSVWHAKSIPDNLSERLWAVLLCVFGIITIMPLITSIGILYWLSVSSDEDIFRQAKFLL